MASSSQFQTSGDAAAEGVRRPVAQLSPEQRLSLEEMTRIMDVASTLRKEQALVEQQFQIDEVQAELRKRLLEAARISGDPVTAEQIDAAVRQYYDRLYQFEEPPLSLRTVVAHLWVRRRPVLLLLGVALAAVAAFWTLLAAGLLPGETRSRDQLERQLASLEGEAAAIEKLTDDPAALRQAATARAAATAALERGALGELATLTTELEELALVLVQEYTLSIPAEADQQTGLQREFTDESGTRTSGFYIFVEARDPRGNLVQVPIVNRETGRTERVSRWGEQVPAAVFERLAADKRADGVLDERVFGAKRRGEPKLETILSDAAGRPLERMGQITRWE